MSGEPSRARKIGSAVAVALLVWGIWALVEKRGAPPVPPEVKLPWEP